MCLAQGHNTVTPVWLKSRAPLPQVKHSTTKQLCSKMRNKENSDCSASFPIQKQSSGLGINSGFIQGSLSKIQGLFKDFKTIL